MKKDDFYEEDDGRTIADMSGIERQPTFLPHFHRKRSDFSAPDAALIVAMQLLWS